MTINSSTRKAGPFLGDAVTTVFPFTFKVFTKNDVQVTLTSSSGAETQLVLDSNYTVSVNADQTVSPGGTVTYPATLAIGYKLTITGSLSYLQPTSLPNNGPFYPQTVEAAFDRDVILIQQIKELVDRSIKINVSDAPLAPLPSAAARANALVGFDAIGNSTVYPITASVGAGDMKVDTFTAGVDFTTGVTTALNLSRAPGNQANAEVFFDSAFQGPDQWSVSGTILTFTSPIPVGVAKVFVRLGTTLSTQIPPGGSVGDGQIVWNGILNRVVGSIADLRLLDRSKYDRAFAISYYTGNAKGGGAYWKKYDAAPAGWENGGSQIVAADGAGWQLQFENVLHGDQFGIRADNTGDESGTVQAAILAMYNAGGGYVDLPVGNIRLTNQFLLYPNVYVRGQGKARTYLQWQGGAGLTVMRMTQLTPGILSIGGGVSDLTINGQSTANGITGIDLSDAEEWKIRAVEFANLIYGLYFNKYATASGSPFGGQAYFNQVEQCEFVQCGSCVAFGGAANRNTFSTNTLRSSQVAYDFGIPGNASETNVFINENVEGCHSWAEWSGTLANIYSQTWVGLTVENPTTNGYPCLVKDPGRQNFFGLTLIPANNVAAVSFYGLFNDGSGRAILSDVFGTRGSSGGYSGYGNRTLEDLHFLGDTTQGGSTIRTRAFGQSGAINQTIAAGNFVSVNISVPGARIGDAIAWSISTLYPTLTISGPAVAANDVVSFSLFNNSGSSIAVNAVLYAAVVARPTSL